MKTANIGPTEKLSLTNDGQLEVFFIGTGSAFAKRHFQTHLLLVKGNTHLMVDFGMTGPLALETTAHLDHGEINNLLISHSHADHIGGLECLALNRRYVGIPFQKRPKLKMIITESYQEVLWDRSLRGGMEWNEEEANSHKRLCFTDFFDPIRPGWLKKQPREVYEVDFEGLHLEMFRTKHIPDKAPDWQASFVSFGLFVDGHVFISMDTRFDKDLLDEYADRSSVMFHDVQFFPGAVHAPLADLRTLPTEVKAKMHLMHYADNWEAQDIAGFAGWAEQGVRYIF